MARVGCIIVIVLAALAGGARAHGIRAQEAGSGTQIKIFVPWNTDGTLNSTVTVSSQEILDPPGGCQAGAISTQRPDAWRCVTADPCFAPPLAAADADQTTLACARAPWTDSVTLLTISGPLRSGEDCQTAPRCRQPLNLDANPWAVELANGVRCTLMTGTISSLGGVGLVYGCEDASGMPAGDAGTARQGLDRSQPTWQVFYRAPGSGVLEQVGVAVAWF